jgi:hypothetical protein
VENEPAVTQNQNSTISITLIGTLSLRDWLLRKSQKRSKREMNAWVCMTLILLQWEKVSLVGNLLKDPWLMECKILFNLVSSLLEAFLKIKMASLKNHRERSRKREGETLDVRMPKKSILMVVRFRLEVTLLMTQRIPMIPLRTNLLMLMKGAFLKVSQMESLELLTEMTKIILPISKSAISNQERSRDKKLVVKVPQQETQLSLDLSEKMLPIQSKRLPKMTMMNRLDLRMREMPLTQATEITCNILMSYDKLHI